MLQIKNKEINFLYLADFLIAFLPLLFVLVSLLLLLLKMLRNSYFSLSVVGCSHITRACMYEFNSSEKI